MKTRFILLVIVIAVLSMGTANSQIDPSVTATSIFENDKAIIDQHVSEYAVFTIDKRELIDSLYTNRTCKFRIHIDEQRDWILNLEFNDMRAPDFRQTCTTNEGIFEVEEPFIVNTFKGKTSDGQIVRFTIDENTFSGIILYDQYHYVIRSAKDYTRNSADESLIVYKSSDIISENEKFDYINDALGIIENVESEDIIRSTTNIPCTYYLKIATDADYEFYQALGGNLTNTYNHILSILNIVEGVYVSTFNMKFIVTYQNVYTTSNTPYTTTNAGDLLTQFQTHWNNNRPSVVRNIAHLFTGKNIDNGVNEVYGVAYIGHINDPQAYSISKFRPEMYQTTAHEIGHNLNATDNPSGCQCSTSNASVMCQGEKAANLWFCEQSTRQIGPFIYSKISILGGQHNSLSLLGPSTGYHDYQAKQKITSTQEINGGFTSYKAGTEIVLSPGFQVNAGTQFSATIDNIPDCYNAIAPINVAAWKNAVCRGSALQFSVTNATNYSIEVRNQYYTMVHSSSGSITSNPVTVWNVPSSLQVDDYAMYISFSSPFYEVSDKYSLLVWACRDNTPIMFEAEDDEITLQKALSDNPFDFNIYPNPNDGNFIIKIDTEEIQPFFVEIFDSSGVLVSKTEYCSVYQINVNHTGLPQGIYYVKLSMGNNISTKKIVIQ